MCKEIATTLNQQNWNKEEVYIKEKQLLCCCCCCIRILRVSAFFFLVAVVCRALFFVYYSKRLDKPVFCFVTHYLCYCYYFCCMPSLLSMLLLLANVFVTNFLSNQLKIFHSSGLNDCYHLINEKHSQLYCNIYH